MWKIKYKPNNNSHAWITLDSYDKKSQALIHAGQVSGKHFKVYVIDPENNKIWSNY